MYVQAGNTSLEYKYDFVGDALILIKEYRYSLCDQYILALGLLLSYCKTSLIHRVVSRKHKAMQLDLYITAVAIFLTITSRKI
jgi:hypothetical protein